MTSPHAVRPRLHDTHEDVPVSNSPFTQAEADALVAKANTDAAELVERRGRMAQDKIAAAERAALADLRNTAAAAAATAAGSVIASQHNAKADQKLVDEAIGAI